MAMELSSQSAKRLFKQPGTFALAVIKQFRANQGVLLAGAVAYYTLLSLVPLLILTLLALSHIVDEERLLVTLRASLEFVVPGQADAMVGELRNFFTHREVDRRGTLPMGPSAQEHHDKCQCRAGRHWGRWSYIDGQIQGRRQEDHRPAGCPYRHLRAGRQG